MGGFIVEDGRKIGRNIYPIVVKSSAGFEALVSTVCSLCVVLRLQTDWKSQLKLGSCVVVRTDCLCSEGCDIKFGDDIE